jgi:hypothetical protein
MGILDSIAGWIQDVREARRERKRARLRRREAGVRPSDKVRDGLTGRLLRVVRVRDSRANEYIIDGVSLPDYGRNSTLDCDTDIVVECRPPNSGNTYAYPASRIVPLDITAREYARDRFTGDVLMVKGIHETVAAERSLNGTPLAEYGINQRLECADDWVIECTYYYSRQSRTYEFPVSRLAPGKYPTASKKWKEEVINSKTCYSCNDGRKRRERQSACRSCRGRIFQRDGRVCQQKGCDVTDSRELSIHHLWYRPNPVTGAIPDRHLIVLCNDHHRERHGIDDS